MKKSKSKGKGACLKKPLPITSCAERRELAYKLNEVSCLPRRPLWEDPAHEPLLPCVDAAHLLSMTVVHNLVNARAQRVLDSQTDVLRQLGAQGNSLEIQMSNLQKLFNDMAGKLSAATDCSTLYERTFRATESACLLLHGLGLHRERNLLWAMLTEALNAIPEKKAYAQGT